MKLNENIKALREELGMTQSELAEALFVTPQSVSRWEKGLAYPDIEKLPQLSQIFGVSVDELLGVAPSTTYALTRKLITAREKERAGTPQDKLEYLGLLEKCFQSRSHLFRLKDEMILPEERFIEIFENVKSRLSEIQLPQRNRILTNIVINESEERLSEWKSFITDDNNFACWHDLLLFRYFVNGKEPEWSLQRAEVLFQDISKILYLMNHKGSPSSLEFLHGKYDTVETCLAVKRVIDVFSVRDDDIFISNRINAETCLAQTYINKGNFEQFGESLKRLKVLLTVSRNLVGEKVWGSTELFKGYGFEYGIDRFSNDYFDIEVLLEIEPCTNYKDEPIIKEFISFNRGSVDPFCNIDYKERKIFEQLLGAAKRKCKNLKLKENQCFYVFAAMTAKGAIYDYAVDISDGSAQKEFIEMLEKNGDLQIRFIVGMLYDAYNDGCVELPSHKFREMLCDLDKRNLDTRTILNGNYFYVVKTFRQTMHPNVLIKYEQ